MRRPTTTPLLPLIIPSDFATKIAKSDFGNVLDFCGVLYQLRGSKGASALRINLNVLLNKNVSKNL